MTDYSQPVNESDLKKARNFYDIIAWGGLLIVLLPVGIANIILGYFLGDSPCSLCWSQRQEMAYIGVTALFMVRFGFKPKYLATMLVMAAVGLYFSFRHYSSHAMRDIGQGFGLDVFGIHTQFWAEIVFWCVVMLFGLATYLAPRFDALIDEMKGKSYRPMKGFYKIAFGIVAFICASNTFQAAYSTGPFPYAGQGDPVRFSWNPKYITWSTEFYDGFWDFKKMSLFGQRGAKTPDFAYDNNAKALNIDFQHDANNAPVALNGMLSVANVRKIEGINKPVNTLAQINGEYFVGSKYDFWVLDNNLAPRVTAAYDPWYSANVLDVVAFTPYEDGFVIVGSNKSIIRARLNPNADDVKSWGNFTAGRTQVEPIGTIGRSRIDTHRAKYSYIHSAATDGKYTYLATVPDQLNQKKLVISKALEADWNLSAEFMPAANLKEGRTLGELYITGMVHENGKLYAVSKNYNVIVEIDIAAEAVTGVWGIPAELTDVRGLVKNGDVFEVVDTNRIVTLTK